MVGENSLWDSTFESQHFPPAQIFLLQMQGSNKFHVSDARQQNPLLQYQDIHPGFLRTHNQIVTFEYFQQ